MTQRLVIVRMGHALAFLIAAPKQYFAWVDAVWKDPSVERVEVGPL